MTFECYINYKFVSTLHKSHGDLGFCDMEAFNLSMLGKQGWKLIHDPNFLLTRILNAKYFLRKGFLEAGIGHNPSYTWRSTWRSQNLIKLGYTWKIGDGSQINIWTSPWIRSVPTLKPSTPPSPNTEELSVKDLLNHDLVSWNSDLIHSIFNYTDAAAIISIPLRERQLVDSCVWNHTVDGAYSVKSAYNLCMFMVASARPNNNEIDRNWNLIWKQQIPPKVQAFMWRTAHSCLPTCCQLLQKVFPVKMTVFTVILWQKHTLIYFSALKIL